MSFKIYSQLSESQIESDVASYLGYITPLWSERFRLTAIDEQTTGADKLFDRFIPIYLQFKVSEGLDPNGLVFPLIRNKPLPRIISFRSKNNLTGNPILYFPLRKMAANASDFQHNILLRLHRPPNQFGLYVAPLTLSSTEYEKSLSVKWYQRFWPKSPFLFGHTEINDPMIDRNLTVSFNPFLRQHISIHPHKLVDTHMHHYSFSNLGGDVAWHGGEILNDDFRLSTQYLRILNYANLGDKIGFSRESFYRFINEFTSEDSTLRNEQLNANGNNLSDPILTFSQFLKFYYNIKLMILYRI